jgi:hypothetical protein
MKQNHLVIKEKIIAIETQFEVDSWIVNGIYIWPYVRIELYSLLLKNYNLEPNTEMSVEKNIIKGATNKLLAKFTIVSNLVVGFLNLDFFFHSLSKKKLVFFGSHIHRVKHGQEYFNRFFDSMISSYGLENEIYMVEYQKIYQSNYNSKAIIPLEKLLSDFKLIAKLNSKFRREKNSYSLENYESFISVLENEIENTELLKITVADLIKWSNKIQNLVGFYKRFFLKVKPEKVIFSGYFGRDYLYAAVLAANDLKIITVDFQHGTQSNVHMVFSSWTKMPLEGFNIMPKQYWSWDEKSKIYIDYWAKNTSNIVTKVVGQPYLQYWKQKCKNLKSEKKVVLYTLNLMSPSEMFNEALGKLINSLGVLWMIRLHPRNEFGVNDIIKCLDSLGVDKSKYEIHDAKEVPLPEIMSKTSIHITAFSGALIEAKMMGIPTIIIEPIGKEIYNDYIDSELVFYLDKNKVSFEFDFLNLYIKIKEINNENENLTIINPVLV